MFPSKPDRVLAAGIALLVQPSIALPAFATEAALLDDTALRQSIAPATPEEREPREKASKPEQRDDRHTDISQIVRPTETELRTTTPELPLGLNIRATESSRLSDPATNLVFSGNLTPVSGITAP